MSREQEELERQAEDSRARLDRTTLSIDFLRSFRDSSFGAVEKGVRLTRRHPVPAILIAFGAGWLLHRFSRKRARHYSWRRRIYKAEEIPILNTGQARIYDPDASPLHPMQDLLESRREMSARV